MRTHLSQENQLVGNFVRLLADVVLQVHESAWVLATLEVTFSQLQFAEALQESFNFDEVGVIATLGARPPLPLARPAVQKIQNYEDDFRALGPFDAFGCPLWCTTTR